MPPDNSEMQQDLEASLKQAEERARFFESVLVAAPGVFLFGRDGRCRYANPRAARAIGLDPSRVVGRYWKELGLPASVLQVAGAQAREVLATGRSASGDVALPTPRGVRHYEYSLDPFRGPDGAVDGLLIVGVDATAREDAQRSLREKEELLRRILESASVAMALVGLDGTLLEVNPAMCDMLGYSEQELLARRFHDITHPEDLDISLDAVHRLLSGQAQKTHVEKRYIRKDGQVVWGLHSASLLRDQEGQPLLLIGMAVDITERKRVEEELRESEGKYRQLYELESDAIFLIDNETGRILEVNSASTTLYGYTRPELLSRTNADMSAEPDKTTRATMHQLRRVPIRWHRKKNGTPFPVEITATHFVWKGRPVHIAACRDIAERIDMERRLLRAQRLEAAGRIAGQVAHDFNNLLGPMVAYPELIKRQLPPGHPAQAFCDAMLDVAQQMADINTDMLALARRGLLDEQPTDLNRLVEQAAAFLMDAPSTLVVDLDLAPNLLPVCGSPAQLVRAITNLVINAREAMQDIGLLRIKTENAYVDRSFGRYNRIEVGEYVVLSIADTGCGIPAEIRDRVFDAFFTTKRTSARRGSGLGLSVVQAIVDDHRGYFDLETEVGRGSCFKLYLPSMRGPAEQEQAAEVAGGHETVLVVDDDHIQRQVTARLLEGLGYRVETVDSGEQAVTHLKAHHADLLVLDMVMPDGISGAETYRRVAGFRSGQRAIIVSGYAETAEVREMQAMGAGPYLRKPLTLERLARAVRKTLDGGH